MKRIIKYLLFILDLPLFFSACSNIEQQIVQEKPSFVSAKTRSDLKISSNDFDITSEMALYYASSCKKESFIKSIKPYEIEDLTCLYIVNFEKGWMIIPSDARVQPILGESESGNIDIGSLDNPGVKVWLMDLAETIATIKEFGIDEYNQDLVNMWNLIRAITRESKEISMQQRDTSSDRIWIKYTETTTSTIVDANVNHLLSTKWGQSFPWNITFPEDPNALNVDDTRFPTGCVPTAISQVLYYFHNYTGYPNDLWHNISVCSISGNDPYTITLTKSNHTVNSTRWYDMSLAAPLLLTPADTANISVTGYRYVSDLMLDIGERMNAEYSMGGTGADLFYSWHLNPCGINCQAGYYDYSIVKSNLLNSKPIIIIASSNSVGASHAWVIDGCYDRTLTTTVTSHYYYYHPGYSYPPYVTYLTESEVLAQYPNAYDGFSVVESSTEAKTQYLLMNFGWSGEYNYGHYSILNNNTDWALGLNQNKRIFYNITTGQLN